MFGALQALLHQDEVGEQLGSLYESHEVPAKEFVGTLVGGHSEKNISIFQRCS
jgi:hypothetical protein